MTNKKIDAKCNIILKRYADLIRPHTRSSFSKVNTVSQPTENQNVFSFIHELQLTVSYFSKEDVEKCKQKDLLEQTMSEMIGEFPALHQTIVAERDIYLTHTLRQATCCVEAPPNAQSMYYTAQ